MSLSEAGRAEVYQLLAGQREGEEDQASLERLKSILHSNSDARQYYVQQSLLAAHLGWMIARHASTAPPVVDNEVENQFEDVARASQQECKDAIDNAAASPQLPGPQKPTVLSFLGVLDLLPVWLTPKIIVLTVASLLGSYFAVLALSVILSRAHSVVSPDGRPHEPAESFATMSRAVEPRWQGGAPRRADRRITTKEYVLEAGLVEFTLDAGARVVIEGPARFQSIGANSLSLAQGHLLAQVPPRAVGFRVTTPTAEVVDRGTEFDVAVDRQGSTDVHVRTGRVEVKPAAVKSAAIAATAGQTVIAGQAVRVSIDDRRPVPIEFGREHFATIDSILPAPPATPLPTEDFAQGAPIWLGNLFDDRPTARLADAVRTDPFKSVPKAHFSLGVERVYHAGQFFGSDDGIKNWDGGGKLQITPKVVVDLTNLGWKGVRSGAISNDACNQWEDLAGGIVRPVLAISTRGTMPVAADSPKIEEGIGMQPDAMLTFDLDEIRTAGDLTGRTLAFYSPRAGIADNTMVPGSQATTYMAVFVSNGSGEIVAAMVNGHTVPMVQREGTWSVAEVPDKPLSGNDEPVPFFVRISPDARYLTLVTTTAGDANSDLSVWSGACLKVVH